MTFLLWSLWWWKFSSCSCRWWWWWRGDGVVVVWVVMIIEPVLLGYLFLAFMFANEGVGIRNISAIWLWVTCCKYLLGSINKYPWSSYLEASPWYSWRINGSSTCSIFYLFLPLIIFKRFLPNSKFFSR